MKATIMTKANIEEIIGTTDELAIRDINEVLAENANPKTWQLTSVTIRHIETATMARKPVRMTKKQAEAVIEASKVSPTTEELEERIEKIKSRMSSMGILETDAETDFSQIIEIRKEKHAAYREARLAFEVYADSENPDHAEVMRLHTAKQAAYEVYNNV